MKSVEEADPAGRGEFPGDRPDHREGEPRESEAWKDRGNQGRRLPGLDDRAERRDGRHPRYHEQALDQDWRKEPELVQVPLAAELPVRIRERELRPYRHRLPAQTGG
jgi:hypothetical protein